jgi:hypothetical protein
MATVEKKLSRPQLTAIKTLLSKMKLTKDGPSIISGFTEGRTEHASDMTPAEAAAMITYLHNNNPEEQRLKKMRNKVLWMAHEMSWYDDPPKMKGGKPQVCMDRVNNWCIKYGQFSKPLDDHSASEMAKLLTQFQEVYKSHLKGL